MTTTTYNRETYANIITAMRDNYFLDMENGNYLRAEAWDNTMNRFDDNFGNVQKFEKSLRRYVNDLYNRVVREPEYQNSDLLFETEIWQRYVSYNTVLRICKDVILPMYA